MNNLLNPSARGKLYHREKEEASLRAQYAQARDPNLLFSRFVVIHGPTGVGKSALAESLHADVAKDGGYFIKAKFDQLQRPDPHTAFRTAFQSFAHLVIDRGSGEIERIRSSMKNVIGEERRVLIDLIPDLVTILGEYPNPPFKREVYKGTESVTNRFHSVFRLFLRAVASSEHPIVVFLDDLHWADEIALGLLSSLVLDGECHGCMFLATYRDHVEISRLQLMFSHLESSDIKLTKISVGELSLSAIKEMLRDLFGFENSALESISDRVYRQARGNIYFTLEFLRALIDAGVLHFDRDSDAVWIYEIELDIEVFDSMDDLIQLRISSLPGSAQDVLQVSACLGSAIDLELLSHIRSEENKILEDINLVASKGLVVCHSEGRSYAFSHDCVQEATYNRIALNERPLLHYRIGKQLWKNLNTEKLNKFVFVVIGQLMDGTGLVVKEKERLAVAKLCLRGAERAVELSSFHAAYAYLRHGISMLHHRAWRDDYHLCMDLYCAAAEIAYCCAQFDDVSRFSQELLSNAREYKHTLRMQSTVIYTLGTRGDPEGALVYGIDVLRAIGIRIPLKPTKVEMFLALRRIKRRLRRITDEAILRLPDIDDPTIILTTQIITNMLPYSILARVHLLPFLTEKLISVTLDRGLSAAGAAGFTLYSTLLCWIGKDIDDAYRFGKLGLDIQEKFQSQALKGRAMSMFYSTAFCYKHSPKDALEPLMSAHLLSLSSGDIECAMFGVTVYILCMIDITPIAKLIKSIRMFRDSMHVHGQELSLQLLQPTLIYLLALSGQTGGDFAILRHEVLSRESSENLKNDTYGVYLWSEFSRMVEHYVFGDYEQAFEHSLRAQPLLIFGRSAGDPSFTFFFDGMTAMAVARKRRFKFNLIRRAERSLKVLKLLSAHSPLNFLGKMYLLQAEIAYTKGKRSDAYPLYTTAICVCKEARFYSVTALAYERTGKFFLDANDYASAAPYLREALAVYEEWGAFAKVDHLQSEIRLNQSSSSM